MTTPAKRLATARREEGQALIVMVLTLIVLLGCAGLVVDFGRAYLVQRELQQAVDAASLAAGQTLPDSENAATRAVLYGATGKNARPAIGTAGPPTVVFKCLQTLVKKNIPCQLDPKPASPCSTNGCNAVQVTQSATVPTLFARIFIPSFKVTARATAGMRGGIPHPLNIMVVLDRTGSMAGSCDVAIRDAAGSVIISKEQARKIDCAKDGVRQLLKGLLPCNQRVNGPCGSAPPLDQVGLMVFPPLFAKDSTPHDNTGDPAHSNINLETSNSCSGELNSAPPWYLPAGASFPGLFLRNSDTGYSVAGVNEVQTVTTASGNFTFTLTFAGQTTAPLSSNATAAVVRSALEGLSTIGSGNVGVTLGGGGETYTITFKGALGATNVEQLSAAPSASVTVITVTDGSGVLSPNYAFAPLSNDYRVSDAQGLNPSSRLVQAITWSSCKGLKGQGSGTTVDGFASETAQGYPGNQYYGVNSLGNTYYTGALLAAQNALAAEAAAFPKRDAQPVIIFLSDGEANAGSANPCATAISAAQAAAEAGTQVYSIAYKLNGDAKCKNVNGSDESPPITAYEAMAKIARDDGSPDSPDLTKFFCPGTTNVDEDLPCQDGDTLAQVFKSIAVALTAPRLYPDDTP